MGSVYVRMILYDEYFLTSFYRNDDVNNGNEKYDDHDDDVDAISILSICEEYERENNIRTRTRTITGGWHSISWMTDENTCQ